MDIAILRMNYECALLLKRRGLSPKLKEEYEKGLWQKFDIEMFLEWLEEEREQIEYARLYDLIKSKL